MVLECLQKRRRVNGMVALRLLLLVGAATLAVGHDDLRRQLRKKRSLPCNPKKDTSCCLDRLRTSAVPEAAPTSAVYCGEEVREGVASEAVPRDVRLGDPLHDVHRHARRPLREVLRPVVGGVRVSRV